MSTLQDNRWTVDPSGCWLWSGTLDPRGYGRIGGRLAHRVIFENHVAPITAGMELHHRCSERRCVNPDHLTEVTSEAHRDLTWGPRRDGHCRRGHLLDKATRYVRPTGEVECRACARESARAYRTRKSEAVA